MHFVVYALDKPGLGEVRARNRPAHRERLRQHEHPLTVIIAGPMLDDEGTMIGSVLIVEAETRAAVEAFVAGDPYQLDGLYDRVDIRRFAWGIGAPAGPG